MANQIETIEITSSSAIRAIGFDYSQLQMIIRFTSSNTGYIYENVDPEDFQAIRDAESVGKEFNKIFRQKNWQWRNELYQGK